MLLEMHKKMSLAKSIELEDSKKQIIRLKKKLELSLPGLLIITVIIIIIHWSCFIRWGRYRYEDWLSQDTGNRNGRTGGAEICRLWYS